MADAHCVLDAELRVVAMNAAAEHMTRRDRALVIGLHHRDAFPDSFDPATDVAYQQVVAEGVERHLRQGYKRDGHELILEIDAYATDEGGVAIFARDITERVRSVEVRRKGEAQRFLSRLGDILHGLSEENAVRIEATRLLADQLGAGWVVNGELTDGAGAAWVVQAEHRREDLPSLSRHLTLDAFGPRAAESMRAKHTLVINGSEAPSHVPSAGSTIPVATSALAYIVAPVLRDGHLVAYLAVIQPSSRAWSPDEVALVEETAERLHVAIVRTRAQSALRDSDRRKDEFLATLAHELRNPLAPVRNGLQILRKAMSEPLTAAKTLAMMERQLSHMARLIDDLLDVSRITSGKVVLKRERLALRAVLDSAIEASRHLIEASRHALTLHVPYEPLFLDADGTRLSQVIGNLINNATKYTPDGGRIDIYADRYGEEVEIRVSDTGVGIPAAMLSHVFDMFAQVGGSSLERSQGGLGIGLSISRQLILMHGGTIQAHSAGAGQGSIFTVRLPLAPALRPESQESAPSERATDVESRRVLVVDDNVDAADSFAAMLALFGHDVRTAYGGPQALSTAQQFPAEFVFCDIGMPGMNGYEVARRLRADARPEPVRLIAVTG